MMREGKDISWLSTTEVTPADLMLDHRMDISGSVYTRMKELGMTQTELAAKSGIDRARISKIISGKHNITIATLAKLEVALSFRLDSGFSYGDESARNAASVTIAIPSNFQKPKSTWGPTSWKTIDIQGTSNTTGSKSPTEKKLSLYKDAA